MSEESKPKAEDKPVQVSNFGEALKVWKDDPKQLVLIPGCVDANDDPVQMAYCA